MKLHLGCGQCYLDGYLNIDFPLEYHTVQGKRVADLHADITTLSYAPESINEIHIHHVFEHFPRPAAWGLLAVWYSWLKPGGTLHIEVPDFLRTACNILNPIASFSKQAVAERHLFGSHEAPWAAHCEGYTPKILKKMMMAFGYDVRSVNRNSWRSTYNFELFACRTEKLLLKEAFITRAEDYLRNFLLDKSELELRLLSTWMDSFTEQLEKGWAR